MEIVYYIFAGIFGLIIGSFLNVCIYRIPSKTFFQKSRSYCPKCGHTLAAKDLVPLFSFIFLGGKCRYCKEKISPRYPIVEGLNAALYVVIFAIFGDSILYAILVAVLCSILIVMSFIDLDTMEIPNGIVIEIIILGLVNAIVNIVAVPSVWWEYLLGAFVISLPFYLIALLTGGGIGGGDIKLMFAAGLFLGWKLALFAGIVGVVIGGILGAIAMAVKKQDGKSQMPLGPSLAIGIVLSIFLGNPLINWYLSIM